MCSVGEGSREAGEMRSRQEHEVGGMVVGQGRMEVKHGVTVAGFRNCKQIRFS